MDSTTLHFVIVAAAWVAVVVLVLAAIGSSVINFRSASKIEARKDLVTRVGRMEAELTDIRDLVDRLSKRWSKRFRDEQTEASTPGVTRGTPENHLGENLPTNLQSLFDR